MVVSMIYNYNHVLGHSSISSGIQSLTFSQYYPEIYKILIMAI